MVDRTAAATDIARIRVVLAISHARTRSALREALEATGEVDVVAEVASALQVVHVSRSERVDVVLLDLRLIEPGTSPTLTELVAGLRGVPIVAVSLEDDPAFARAALHAGAVTHLLTDAAPEDYLRAVRGAIRS